MGISLSEQHWGQTVLGLQATANSTCADSRINVARPDLGKRADLDLQVAVLRQSGKHIQPVRPHGMASRINGYYGAA